MTTTSILRSASARSAASLLVRSRAHANAGIVKSDGLKTPSRVPALFQSAVTTSRSGNWGRTVKRTQLPAASVRPHLLQRRMRWISNFSRRLKVPGNLVSNSLIKPLQKSLSVLRILFRPHVLSSAVLHDRQLSMEKAAWRPEKFSISSREYQ